MKKVFSAILALLLNISPVIAGIVYQSGSYYGLKDDKGKVVLESQYQAIEQLSYTPSKKVIIPMHAMDDIHTKKSGYYKIKKNNLWGVANTSGRITHDCRYKKVELDSNGDLMFTLTDGTVQYAHPVLNTSKSIRDTAVVIVGLPVTIIGAMMIPIEMVSKSGRAK